ncbi:MAG: AlkA N-terminal domain-containing protein [Pseudomonadota bacterium]
MNTSIHTPASTAVSATVLPARAVCERALREADATYDGRFFVGRQIGGEQVYCRPMCTLPGVQGAFYATAGAAWEQGRVPCGHCQADLAAPLPEWVVDDPVLVRALRLLASGFLNQQVEAALAARLELTGDDLTRRFARAFDCAPTSMAVLQRAALARRLLQNSQLGQARVAAHAGYRNLAQMRRELNEVYAQSPLKLRGERQGGRSRVTLHVPLRAPYHFDWLFGYLRKRALPGVEEVSGAPGAWSYQRALAAGQGSGSTPGWVIVQPSSQLEFGQPGLSVDLPLLDQYPVWDLLYRAGRVFDAHLDGHHVQTFLLRQPGLAEWARQAPGLRVAGAWDGYETAVRAVLGQQVSVARGTVLANKMIQQYGDGQFPQAAQLQHREVAELGMPGRRGRAVQALARLVDAGALVADDTCHYDTQQQGLLAIEGIGPWTANYVRMRVSKDVNAFPDNDWVVLKQLQCTAAQARRIAADWSPWRAYALMYLWYAAAQKKMT